MEEKERIFLVGVDDGSYKDFENFMIETRELIRAADGDLVSETSQVVKTRSSATVIGSGKVEEIKIYCDELEIDTVVVSCELSGSQIKNLENGIGKKIIDRTTLILDIFAKRAKSNEGKLQVHLAQLEYRLPRLTGLRSDLSRLGGGIGTRGPGEQKLEVDRRHIQKEIDRTKDRLLEVEKNRSVQRAKRKQSGIPMVALVGYTNAGKSSLINGMMKLYGEGDGDKKHVFVKDMLFATLEPSLRRINLPNGRPVILADTVGFVSDLPTHLVEAFKATLDEIKQAHLILHIVDGSNKDVITQYDTTMSILKDLEVVDIPRMTVVNKLDLMGNKEKFLELMGSNPMYISAKASQDVQRLTEEIMRELYKGYQHVELLIPYTLSDAAYRWIDQSNFTLKEHTSEGLIIEGLLSENDLQEYRSYILRRIDHD